MGESPTINNSFWTADPHLVEEVKKDLGKIAEAIYQEFPDLLTADPDVDKMYLFFLGYGA